MESGRIPKFLNRIGSVKKNGKKAGKKPVKKNHVDTVNLAETGRDNWTPYISHKFPPVDKLKTSNDNIADTAKTKTTKSANSEDPAEFISLPCHHKVTVSLNSDLTKAMKGRRLANSYHHNAVKDLGKGLNAVAKAPDGIVEAVERKDGPMMGVQWHPERPTDKVKRYDGIINWLFNKTGKKNPKIGLIYQKTQMESLQKGDDNLRQYRAAIVDHGGEVININEGTPKDETDKILKSLDGLIVPGGKDVDPQYYGEEKMPQLGKTFPEFDRFELDVIDYAAGKKLPTLGICRGHQLINVYHGGTLYQDIPTQAPDSVKHRIRIPADKQALTDKKAAGKEGFKVAKDVFIIPRLKRIAGKKLKQMLNLQAANDDNYTS